MERNVVCKGCGTSLLPDHKGACPNCGKEEKSHSIYVYDTIKISELFSWERRKEFFEKNPKIKLVILIVTFGSPFLGLIFGGVRGIVIGLLFGVISYLLGPFAVIKVREIERGHS